jgi:hypothetical protein
MSSLICSCGKEKISTQKKICEDCRKEKRKEKSRKDAKAHREKHGSVVKRGIYCCRCKGVKEHQERGYCLACDRERYKDKTKPDCATCGGSKQNPRDAYCNECKREKARIKSVLEGRRPQNEFGRKTTCSNCGREKEVTHLNEGYCKNCKIFRKRQIRPYRTDEQKFKDAVRRLTWRKVNQGFLKRQPCEVCGTEEDVQAHHDDYSKPLDVRWLCRKHHREHHKLNP